MLRLPYVQDIQMTAYVIGFYPAVDFGLSESSAEGTLAPHGQLDPVHRRTRGDLDRSNPLLCRSVPLWPVIGGETS